VNQREQLEAIRGGHDTSPDVWAGITRWGADPVVLDYFTQVWEVEGARFVDVRRFECVPFRWANHLDQWAAAYYAALWRHRRCPNDVLNKAWMLYLEHTFPERAKGGVRSPKRYKAAVLAGLGARGKLGLETGFEWERPVQQGGGGLIVGIRAFEPLSPLVVYENQSPYRHSATLGARYNNSRIRDARMLLLDTNIHVGGFLGEALLASELPPGGLAQWLCSQILSTRSTQPWDPLP
jgi:hypothetical protein